MGFFEGISKKVTETTNNLQETTNKIQKENRCKKTIGENNSKVSRLYNEIGKKVYENRKVDDTLISYIEEKTLEIDKLLNENEDLEKEILALNNMKICKNCKAKIAMNTLFCPQCGTEQEKKEIKEVIPQGKRKCSECGEIIGNEDLFCPNCGTKRQDNPVEEKKDDIEVAKEGEVLAEIEPAEPKKIED